MPRTTIDIDGPVLDDLRRIQKRDAKSLGRTVSDLLAEAISRYGGKRSKPAKFAWISRPMRARVDLADKEAVRAAADAGLFAPETRRRKG